MMIDSIPEDILEAVRDSLIRVNRSPSEQIPIVQDLLRALVRVLAIDVESHQWVIPQLSATLQELQALRDLLRQDILWALYG